MTMTTEPLATIEDTRRSNLAIVREQNGGTWTALNRILGRNERDATLSQIWNRSPNTRTGRPRGMGPGLARDIEQRLGLPRGWMDQRQGQPPAVDARLDPDLHDNLRKSEGSKPTPSGNPTVAASSHARPVSPPRGTVLLRPLRGTNLEDSVVHEMLISPQALRDLLGPSRASDIEGLRLMEARGDTMRPTFDQGDLLLINAKINMIEHEGIYVFSYGEEGYLMARRVQRRADHWLLISDNPVYPPEAIPADRQTRYAVLGRVVFAWRCAAL